MKVLESDLDPNPSSDPHCLCDLGPSYLAPCILSAIALGKVRLMIARTLFNYEHELEMQHMKPAFLGFPGGSDGTVSACNAEDLGLIPGSGRPPGEGNG